MTERKRRRPWVEPVLEAREGEGWYQPEFDPEREGVVAVGIDIIEIARIQRTIDDFGERFLHRVFTERERERYRGRTNELAARFAAKEATIKALGSREPALHEIEVVRGTGGAPRIRLRGRAAELAREQGVRELAVSLSHAQKHAVAVVVLLREGESSPPWE